MDESFAEADDGLRLYTRVVGDGAHTVIVPAAAWLEDHLDPLLKPGRRFVFYDTQARGRSDAGPPERLTFDREVSDLEAVRQHVGAEQVSLIGWSYLGAVVALYASRHASHVRHLALLCPMSARPGPFEGMEPFVELLQSREAAVADELARRRERAEDEPSPETWRAFQLLRSSIRMGDAGAADRIVGNPWRHPQEWATHAQPTLETLFDSLDDFDWRPDMHVVEAPALVVHGGLDGPVAARQEWVDAFPHGRLLDLPDTGHYPFIERPEELFAALDQLLDS